MAKQNEQTKKPNRMGRLLGLTILTFVVAVLFLEISPITGAIFGGALGLVGLVSLSGKLKSSFNWVA